jgi:hypothetical protein
MNNKLMLSVVAAAIAGSAAAQTGTLTVDNLYANENVTWSQDGGSSFESSGSGEFYGTFTPTGGSAIDINFFCVDLQDWISLPTSYPCTITMVDNEAAYLYDNFEATSTTADQQAGMQYAMWALTTDGNNATSVLSGQFQLSSGGYGYSVAAADYANWLLAQGYGHTAGGFEFDHIGDYGQNMLTGGSGANPNLSTPSPAAILPFAFGLIARKRRRSA